MMLTLFTDGLSVLGVELEVCKDLFSGDRDT